MLTWNQTWINKNLSQAWSFFFEKSTITSTKSMKVIGKRFQQFMIIIDVKIHQASERLEYIWPSEVRYARKASTGGGSGGDTLTLKSIFWSTNGKEERSREKKYRTSGVPLYFFLYKKPEPQESLWLSKVVSPIKYCQESCLILLPNSI